MSRMTKGGDGCHWSDCWKTHYDCRLHYFEQMLLDVVGNYESLGCLGKELRAQLAEAADDIQDYIDENRTS